MQYRIKLVKGEMYHVCNKSISNYAIFRNDAFKQRFLTCLEYYNTTEKTRNLGKAIQLGKLELDGILYSSPQNILDMYAYCIMPDHYHLLFLVLKEELASHYISVIQNSYTRFYNLQNMRKGPLWQSRYRVVQIKSSEQLLHVSRYIHLNPSTSKLVSNPIQWTYSSYTEYVSTPILKHKNRLRIQSIIDYQKFVENNIDYQKKLKTIKSFILE